MITDWIKNLFDNMGQLVWIGIVAIAVVVALVLLTVNPGTGTEPQVIQLTLDAASTLQNQYVPTLSAQLTETPVEAAMTAASPTLSLAGRQEVRMYAASAEATSEIDPLTQGAVQAAGPPNTTECGDFATAWATKKPTDSAALTLLYPELVKPTGVIVYETFNPGFITRIDFMDIYGEYHTIYEGQPQLRAQCPFQLVVAIDSADYEGSRLVVYIDQTTSLGGWDQIDAVELIGIRH